MFLLKDNSMQIKSYETKSSILKAKFLWDLKTIGSNPNNLTIKSSLLPLKTKFNAKPMQWIVGNGSCIIKKQKELFCLTKNKNLKATLKETFSTH